MEREGFIAALLPICDFVCEYDRRREKLRVRRSEIAPELAGSQWYTVDALSDALRSKGSIIAERGDVEVGCEFCGAQYTFDPVDAALVFTSTGPVPPVTSTVQ